MVKDTDAKESKYVQLGAILCKERRGRKLSFEDVSRDIKIRVIYIKAMESGEFDALPGGVYTRSYLRSYSQYLGLDGKDFLAKLEEAKPVREKASDLPEVYHPESNPRTIIVIGSLVVLAVAYGAWVWTHRAEPVTDKETQEVVGALTNPAPEIVLVAIEPLSLVVADKDDKQVAAQAMQAGDAYFLPQQEGLVVKVPADKIEIYVDGRKAVTLGHLEQKYGGLVIDAKKLLAAVEIH